MTLAFQSPREVAKFLSKSLVSAYVETVTIDQIADHTDFEEDDRIVRITGSVAGGFAGTLAEPVTDGIVDKLSDQLTAAWAARKAKKTPTK